MAGPYTLIISWIYLAFGVSIFLLGLTILRVGGSSTITRSTALMLFFCGVGPILSATNVILLGSLKEGAVLYSSLLENFEYLWEFYFPSLLLFSLTFPKESRFIQKYGFLSIFLFGPHIFHLVMMMLAGSSEKFITDLTGDLELRITSIQHLFSVLVSLLFRAHREFFSLVNILYAVLAVTFIAKNIGGILSPRIARQVKTVLFGLLVSIATYAFTKLAPFVFRLEIPEDISLALINFSLIAGGGSIGYAVVKQRFLGIRFIVRRSILYGSVSLVFALLYLLVVKPVSVFFGNYSVTGQDAFETGFIILAIIAFQPAMNRFEELLERFLLRGQDDVRAMFRRLGSELADMTSIEELEKLLQAEIVSMLDVTSMKLGFFTEDMQKSGLVKLLAETGDPVTKQEIVKLRDKMTVTQHRRTRVLGDLTFEASSDDEKTESFLPEGMEELEQYDVFVPIMKEKRCIGALALGSKSYGGRFTSEELSLLSVLSNEINIAIENIRLLRESVERKVLEEELNLARRIQSQLLPGDPPTLVGYELHAVNLPSRYVGGDYYDFKILDDSTLVVVVADVSGKGIPASLLMATLHAAVRSNEDVWGSPKEMVERINRLLFESTSAEEFATLFYGVVDLANGELRYTNAGHDFPIMINGADAGSMEVLEKSGIVLGCLEDYSYMEYSCTLPEKGGLALYTDGVTEAEIGGEQFGIQRLERMLTEHSEKSAEELCHLVIDGVNKFTGGSETQDDLTLLVLKRRPVQHKERG